MHAVLPLLIAGLALLAAAAPARADLTVFACEPEWAALAMEIGGDHVKVFTATTAAQDPHRVEARPSLIARFRTADLAVCTGADLEVGWLPLLQRQAGNPKLAEGQPGNFAAASFAMLRAIPASVDRSMGDVHAAGNPHLHLDPRNIAKIAPALAERMAQLDPPLGAQYRARGTDFLQRWEVARGVWEDRAARLRGVPVAVQHHNWVYLSDWLGLVEVVELEPKPGIPPGAAHLVSVLAQLREKPVKAVLVAAYEDPRPTLFVAERLSVPGVTLPFTVGGTPASGTLFALFDDTLARLLQAIP